MQISNMAALGEKNTKKIAGRIWLLIVKTTKIQRKKKGAGNQRGSDGLRREVNSFMNVCIHSKLRIKFSFDSVKDTRPK